MILLIYCRVGLCSFLNSWESEKLVSFNNILLKLVASRHVIVAGFLVSHGVIRELLRTGTFRKVITLIRILESVIERFKK